MSAAVILDPSQELERATSDYLAVSRNSHLYATTGDYERAEVAGVGPRDRRAAGPGGVRAPVASGERPGLATSAHGRAPLGSTAGGPS